MHTHGSTDMTCEMMFDIIRNESVLEDGYYSEEYDTVTYYYEVPVDIFPEGEYDSAECGEISIEFPRSMPFARHASVMISPMENDCAYDLCDIELPYELTQHLIDIGVKRIGVEGCFT